jgi:thiosulfate dehydrogenase
MPQIWLGETMLQLRQAASLALLLWALGPPALAQAPAESWPQPNADALPAGIAKDTVLYGRRLFTETYSIVGPEVRDASMRYAGNNLSCQSCHLKGGAQKFAIPMIGVYGVFPLYIGREDEVRTLEERIEGCMERSMNGRVLPIGGKEMKALVAYIQFLSTGVPVGKSLDGRGSPNLPLLTRAADPKHGAQVYEKNCSLCHQTDGQGQRKGPSGDAKGYLYPPLWGPDSFNDGAGMHRVLTAARFIKARMPLGEANLTDDQAFDVAAFINVQPRPSMPNLERDYPDRSTKPVDNGYGPFADPFSLEQHQLGPFGPIEAFYRAKKK